MNAKFIERIQLTENEHVFMGSPTAHMTGLMYGISVPMMLSTTTVLLDQWEPQTAWEIIRDEKIAFTMGATPFLADLSASDALEACNHDTFRVFVCGGAPVPPAIGRRAAKRLNVNLITVWGMTEMSPLGTIGAFKSGMEELSFDEKMDIKEFKTEDMAISNGSTVRVIRAPYFGKVGIVKSLPHQLTQMESETMVRVAEIEFENGSSEIIPRANLELILS